MLLAVVADPRVDDMSFSGSQLLQVIDDHWMFEHASFLSEHDAMKIRYNII